MMNRTKNIVFIIGGAYGFSSEFKKMFKLKIALSKLTFSHDMARLFFGETSFESISMAFRKNFSDSSKFLIF